jgi:uncharacterized protein YhfF
MNDAPLPDNSVPKSGAVATMWAQFCRAASLPPDTPYQAWYFGDSAELAHELAELVLHGPKRATAGLSEFNSQMPDVKPVANGYSVITEADGTPRGVIRTTRLEQRPFAEVDAGFAWDEGEGDRTLADWKEGHRRFFTRELAGLGREFDESMLVDLERFELVWPRERALAPAEPRILPVLLAGGMAASAALQCMHYAHLLGFDARFEAQRMSDIAGFLGRYDPALDGAWLLVHGGAVQGSIVVDHDAGEGVPELRWFIVSDALRGQGWGRKLMRVAMDFCRARHDRVVLHTLPELDAACRLYDAFGWRRFSAGTATHCGVDLEEWGYEWTR